MYSPNRPPTDAEQQWLDTLANQVGCICCRRRLGAFNKAEILYMGARDQADAYFHTIPLCYRHLRSGEDSRSFTSYYPVPLKFIRRNGHPQMYWNHVVLLVGHNPLTDSPVDVRGRIMARQAAMLCGNPKFLLFLDRYRSYLRGVEIPDGTHNAEDARDAILSVCKVRSRALIDHDKLASRMFIRLDAKFVQWQAAGLLGEARPALESIKSKKVS